MRLIDDTDLHRVQAYLLLAALLARPPTGGFLDRVSALAGDGTEVGDALGAIGQGAARTPAHEAEREFNRLFIGVDRGELVPYASYYRTGFLQDRPLMRLRADMDRLGIARAPGVAEPEDHIAALAEMMAGLIDGRFGAPATPGEQAAFFNRHLAPWAGRFFADLEAAAGAAFYRPVGTLGRLFLDTEQRMLPADLS